MSSPLILSSSVLSVAYARLAHTNASYISQFQIRLLQTTASAKVRGPTVHLSIFLVLSFWQMFSTLGLLCNSRTPLHLVWANGFLKTVTRSVLKTSAGSLSKNPNNLEQKALLSTFNLQPAYIDCTQLVHGPPSKAWPEASSESAQFKPRSIVG